MDVLVVGGTGFVGEALSRELDDRGHDVTALSRDPSDASLPGSVRRVSGDVSDYDSIEGAFDGQDAVVNLVALSTLFRPIGGEERHFTVHRDGTAHVIRAAEAYGVPRLVQMSGLGADPEGPTAYIRAKGQAEALVRSSDLEWVIFQPSVIFGDGDEFTGAVKRLALPYITPLPSGGSTPFQPIWIEDFTPMLAEAAEGADGRGEATEGSDGRGEATARGEARPGGRDGDRDEYDGEERDDDRDDDREDHPNDKRGRLHVGQTYQIGGPEVLTLADVARLAHAADGRPVRIVPVPMPLAWVGLRILEFVPASVLDAIPLVPRMGTDQYRSLQFDSTTADNDVVAFGVDPADLKRYASYLGVE